MPQLNPVASDVHVNGPLTNISVAFTQDAGGFVADRAFPNVPVDKQSDLYYTYPKGEWNRDEMKKRADATESAGGGYTVATDSYFADVWALHKDVSDRVRGNADSVLRPDREATEWLTMQAMISREVRWATNFFTTSVWATDVTPSVLWSAGGSTPIEDIRLGIKTVLRNTGYKPNTLVLGADVYYILIDHADIIDRVKYGAQPGRVSQVDLPELQSLFKIPNILVMEGIRNTAAEGATAAHSFIGGKHALLCYASPSPGLMTPSAGYTFSWNGYLGATADGRRITKFRMEHLRSDRVEIEMAYAQKTVASDLGYFFNGAVA